MSTEGDIEGDIAGPAPVAPAEGLGVLHLFCRPGEALRPTEMVAAVGRAEQRGTQVVTVAVLGHKADVAFMVLDADVRQLRRLQTDLAAAGLDIVDSYVSITEVSEYAPDLSEGQKRPRLYPELPPAGKPAWGFYPMSKRRGEQFNWYTLGFEERRELMYEHGASGRKFAGRVVQLITASTGLDDFEWGVTLFCEGPDDLKDVVYTLRYDEASARYAEFGTFYFGIVTPTEELAGALLGPPAAGPRGPL